MELVRLLVEKHRNITVVGDDDQSIYGWRGAQVKNILGFPSTFKPCKVIRLERNYRSTPQILALANAVIEKNKDRHGKVLKPFAQKGPLPELFVFEDEDAELDRTVAEIQTLISQGTKASEIAVLYRSNGQGGAMEAVLRQQNIPYAIKGGTAFFERKETKDALAYLRCAMSPNEVSFRRIINTPTRGIGDTTVEQISQYAQSRGMSFFRASKQWREAGIGDRQGAALEELHAQLKKLIPYIVDSPNGESAGYRFLKALVEIGYKGWLFSQGSNPAAQAKRWSHIEALSGILDRFVDKGGRKAKTIRDFVDSMELRDEAEEEEEEKTRKSSASHSACF
jgi:superfamily I DNA/RNA helicase